MLVLSRKVNESIVIGDGIEVKVIKVSGGRVKIGIVADSFIDIRRGELVEQEFEICLNDAEKDVAEMAV